MVVDRFERPDTLKSPFLPVVIFCLVMFFSSNSSSILCSLPGFMGLIVGGCLRYYRMKTRVPVRCT